MKLREVNNSKIPAMLGACAITLYPFILFDGEPEPEIIYHEYVHVKQIQRLGWFKFYYSYIKEYVMLRLRGLSHIEAYYEISFEKEAFASEDFFAKQGEHAQKTMLHLVRVVCSARS